MTENTPLLRNRERPTETVRFVILSTQRTGTISAKEQQTLQRLLLCLNLDSVTVRCESIASQSRGAGVGRLLSFLSVEPDMGLAPRSTKITPDDLGQGTANYEKVAGALAGTAYQQFLDQAINRGDNAPPSD